MLPLQQALEVKVSIEEYLKATFNFKEKDEAAAFDAFLNDPQDGIFKGPYVGVRLPFRPAPAAAVPLEIGPQRPPYAHQFKAFARLTTQGGHVPEPTLITTGTGSGKTECFLYPVLDYCYQQRHRPGIKVIILYPMNALATDQAKRLAEAIWADERLKGVVRAGLFIGEGKKRDARSQSMGPDHVVEDRQTIVDSPPDILLTNFKMLDYGLLRAVFHPLWTANLADPGLLRFLVLDELHTYDGAQGTDVANLLRRLHLKLDVPAGQICPVGTSATLGAGADARQRLRTYAGRIFGVPFPSDDAVIGEERQVVADFLDHVDPAALDPRIPLLPTIGRARIGPTDTYDAYLRRQCELWGLPTLLPYDQDQGASAVALGHGLRGLRFVYELLRLTPHHDGLPTLPELAADLAGADGLNAFRQFPAQQPLPGVPGAPPVFFNPQEEFLHSILALLAAARTGPVGGPATGPLVQVQVQLWVREVRNVLRELAPTPRFGWPRLTTPPGTAHALPPWQCRECGASGWLAHKPENREELTGDTKKVYEQFFSPKREKSVWMMTLYAEPSPDDEYEPTHRLPRWLDPVTLHLHDDAGAEPPGPRLHVLLTRKLDEQDKRRDMCPHCATDHSLSLIGTRVPTLSSIAVSQTLSSDLDPRPDATRKVLAFTNAVQDAAHQAGFVQARNYRFTFRASLQHILNQQPGGAPVALPALEAAFRAFWKPNSDPTGQAHPEAYYYRFFPADYAGKADLKTDYRDAAGQLNETFKREFDLRVDWDIRAEFGYNARVGRTLEKTGSAGVVFDEARLRGLYAALRPWLVRNELAADVGEAAFPAFLSGLLHRIRIRGGVDHPFLEQFRSLKLDTFHLNWSRWNAPHFLNRNFGPRTRLPKPVTTAPAGSAGQWLDSTHGRGRNWFSYYFARAFPEALPGNLPVIHEFYEALFECLERAGLVNVRTVGGLRNYCLTPDVIRVMNRVVELHCPKCTSVLWVGAADTVSAGAPCLTYRCDGHYGEPRPAGANYYQAVYNRQRSPRIYAAEHTGLLPRGTREKLEVDFKNRPAFNSYNALVATSTLEMGIDIGTLNVVLLNAVPPTPANYLQRVGRAGRATGSALVTTFAQGQSHDLFYYAEPRAMMAGEVSPPGCFLEARDILRRHFFAFCLDTWASADPAAHVIPSRLQALRLEKADLHAPELLPNRLVAWIDDRVPQLLQRFQERYAPDVNDGPGADQAFKLAFQELRAHLAEDVLAKRLRGVFGQVQQEYRVIRERRQQISQTILKKKLAPNDPERIALEADRKALGGLRKLLDRRLVLEHLTNTGLLPNYAFPETGVTLAGQVRWREAKGSTATPSRQDYEIVRPASQALTELAPDTLFYAQGYHFRISGLNTADWSSGEGLMRKRFCSRCDHLADDVLNTTPAPTCPACGDAAWGSAQNVHHFVKLAGVKSSDRREDATLDDRSDDRDPERYRTSQHLRFRPEGFQGAWGTPTIPFGFEYHRQVDITKVNLGNAQAVSPNRLSINGKDDVPHHGFVTCRHCGKSTSKPQFVRPEDRERFHYAYCNHAEREYLGQEDADVFREVYLFTTTTTEALRILLPVQEFEAEAAVAMFEAGLSAALKRYYQGSPAHIDFCAHRAYNIATQRFDRYLVLYDTIPGGTGYLATLFQPAEFTRLLQLAYETVRDCACQHRAQDGCYRCIYSYRNQRAHANLSRRRAEKLFARIVASASVWEQYPKGLSGVSGTGRIEESELEERFIRVLRKSVEKRAANGWRLTEKVLDGETHYDLRVVSGAAGQQVVIDYLISPQIPLGQAQEVKWYTVSDFYFRPVAASVNETPVEDVSVIRDLALYLDGYTYHATKEHPRFFGDLDKRTAINAAPNKTTWTLTWADLDRAEAEKEADQSDALWQDRQPFTETLRKYTATPLWGQYSSGLINAEHSLDRMLHRLAHSLPEHNFPKQAGLLLSLFQLKLGKPAVPEADAAAVLAFTKAPDPSAPPTATAYVVPALGASTDFSETRVLVGLQSLVIRSASKLNRAVSADLDRAAWEHFWHLYNLVQAHHELVELEAYPEGDVEEVLALYDTDLHPLVQQLWAAGINFGTDGSFLLTHEGQHAEAALGFAEKKRFIRPLSEADRKVFTAAGYLEVLFYDFTLDLLTTP